MEFVSYLEEHIPRTYTLILYIGISIVLVYILSSVATCFLKLPFIIFIGILVGIYLNYLHTRT